MPARLFPKAHMEENPVVEPLNVRSLTIERAARLIRDILDSADGMHDPANARLLRERARQATANMHPRSRSLLLDRMTNVHRNLLTAEVTPIRRGA